MTSRENYDKPDFVLSTDTTTSTSHMEFKRVWKPASPHSKEAGKIWPHDEAPDGNGEVAELKRKIKELNNDLTAEKAKTSNLTAQLAQAQAVCQAEKTQKDNEIKSLKDKFSQLESDKTDLQTKLDQALGSKGDIGQRDAKIAEQASRIAELEKKLQTRPESLVPDLVQEQYHTRLQQ
ncbi:hypothetical protein FAGAP_5266 [Fusarium agapanthi]|uniref:Uncharacterized protein n=1 Tax=Fusarium agapanthi TaxID=1803897 RepID=A0A9P5EF84_9HYPO|nr:hypothetical protein FAGAP_5266 [Fusarium agapanthi]